MKNERLFVIGDIHGCYDELKDLLEKTDKIIKPETESYVFLGDYIDRGPRTKDVIDLLVERSYHHPANHIFLKGNHEDMMLEQDQSWALNGAESVLKSYGKTWVDLPNFLYDLPSEHRKFFNGLRSHYHEGRVYCVHAGINPGIPLDEQPDQMKFWGRGFVKYQGAYPDDVFVVFGHTPNYTLQENPNSLGIDTACVFGGKLTCAIMHVESGNVDDIIQVKSGFDF